MSIGSVDNIMTRIAHASPLSPIAVFVEHEFLETNLNAVFANTWGPGGTQRLIHNPNTQNLIGVFDKRSKADEVEKKLKKARDNGS
jgi:hypothetical protein